MVWRVSEDFLFSDFHKVGSRNQRYADVCRRNRSTKSPRLCLRVQMISSKWSLPRYLTGLQTWRMRREESTRTLLNRLLRRQVCLCQQLSVKPFTHDMLWNVSVFSDRWGRLWRPDVWPEGCSHLRLRRRCDALSGVCYSSLDIYEDQSFRLLYSTEADDEISFNPDDIITNIEMIDEGWWKGQCHDCVGLFPAAYVRLLDWETRSGFCTNSWFFGCLNRKKKEIKPRGAENSLYYHMQIDKCNLHFKNSITTALCMKFGQLVSPTQNGYTWISAVERFSRLSCHLQVFNKCGINSTMKMDDIKTQSSLKNIFPQRLFLLLYFYNCGTWTIRTEQTLALRRRQHKMAAFVHFAMLKSPNYILATTFMKTRSVNINLLTIGKTKTESSLPLHW